MSTLCLCRWRGRCLFQGEGNFSSDWDSRLCHLGSTPWGWPLGKRWLWPAFLGRFCLWSTEGRRDRQGEEPEVGKRWYHSAIVQCFNNLGSYSSQSCFEKTRVSITEQEKQDSDLQWNETGWVPGPCGCLCSEQGSGWRRRQMKVTPRGQSGQFHDHLYDLSFDFLVSLTFISQRDTNVLWVGACNIDILVMLTELYF